MILCYVYGLIIWATICVTQKDISILQQDHGYIYKSYGRPLMSNNTKFILTLKKKDDDTSHYE